MRYYSKRYKQKLSADLKVLKSSESTARKMLCDAGTAKRVWGRFRDLIGGWCYFRRMPRGIK